jgi:hypothetical protein
MKKSKERGKGSRWIARAKATSSVMGMRNGLHKDP